jgi:peptidyl-tRNA hydrolase
VVRGDLYLSPAEVTTQTSQAAISLYKKVYKSKSSMLKPWEDAGAPKDIKKVASQFTFDEIVGRVKEQGLSLHVVNVGGSRTVAAFFGPAGIIEDITRVLIQL